MWFPYPKSYLGLFLFFFVMFYHPWRQIISQQVGCNSWNFHFSYNLNIVLCFSTQCGYSLTLFETMINIPKLCGDAFCEDSLVWQLFPAFKRSVVVKSKPLTIVLSTLLCICFFCRKHGNDFRVHLSMHAPSCSPSGPSWTKADTWERGQSRTDSISSLTSRLYRWIPFVYVLFFSVQCCKKYSEYLQKLK